MEARVTSLGSLMDGADGWVFMLDYCYRWFVIVVYCSGLNWMVYDTGETTTVNCSL